MKDEKYIVTGMTCSACSSRVEKTVNNLAGVQNASVNLLTGTMKVAHDDSLTAEDIIAAVEKAGYGASLPEGTVKKHHNSMQDEQRGMKKRLILSISLLIPFPVSSVAADSLCKPFLFYKRFPKPVAQKPKYGYFDCNWLRRFPYLWMFCHFPDWIRAGTRRYGTC